MLALVAGLGDLPAAVYAAVAERGDPLYLVEFEGRGSTVPQEVPRDLFRLENLGSLLQRLTDAGVTEVCFAGAVTRPEIDPTKIDVATAPLIQRIAGALAKSDDAALREFLAMFEEAGLTIRAAHNVAPDLLPVPGILTETQPGDGTEADATRGTAVVGAMGAADVGQACVIHRRQALAVEALLGTDWMLDSLAAAPQELTGGILYKAPKPDQDRRVDLPTIGPDTVARAAKAGLRGIVIPEGGVMVLDRDATVRAADKAGLFLWVREAS